VQTQSRGEATLHGKATTSVMLAPCTAVAGVQGQRPHAERQRWQARLQTTAHVERGHRAQVPIPLQAGLRKYCWVR